MRVNQHGSTKMLFADRGKVPGASSNVVPNEEYQIGAGVGWEFIFKSRDIAQERVTKVDKGKST